MKKSILFSTIIGALLFMTSCLGEISNNYADTTLVYIDSDMIGNTYGKTISAYPRLIVSDEMMMMNPGTIKLLSYSWDEAYGTKSLSLEGQTIQADAVRLSGEKIDVDHAYLLLSELPEEEESESFIDVADPIFSQAPEFMGDYWVFAYAYNIPKGQTAHVEFYKREDDEGSQNNVMIDVQLTFLGSAEGTSKERKTEYLALDMSTLRYQYEGGSSTDTKDINIRFSYNVEGRTEPVTTQAYILQVKGD